MSVLYFLIALVASLIGAMAGLGGGMIIKPVLDVFNHYNAEVISVLSSITVFAMATVTMGIQTFKGARIKGSTMYIASGAAFGGLLGKYLFQIFVVLVGDDALSKGYQSLLLLLVLVFALVMSDISLNSKHLHNPLAYGMCGMLLGALSTFLGIGGGPLNVAMLVTLFSLQRKEAVFDSIIIIFASQGMRLLVGVLTLGFVDVNLEMAIYLVPGGILGGVIGSVLYRKLTIEKIMVVFNLVTLIVILINIFNAWRFFNAY